MRHVKEYVEEQLETLDSKALAIKLQVSVSMLSNYKHQGCKPSLAVAKTVYTIDNVVLHPFSEESLKYELEK